MNVDKWFEEQNLVVKIILIVLPFVGWIMEILIRISAYLRNKNVLDLVLLIVFLLLGWSWIPLIVDVVYIAMKGHIFLSSDLQEVTDELNKEEKQDNKETVDAQEKKEDKEEK